MSLAARCPSCGTVFRVVQDQLRVSEGWVRCGRCSEVFNAIESLVEIDADAAPRAPKTPRSQRVIEDLARATGVDLDDEVDELPPPAAMRPPLPPSPPPPAAEPAPTAEDEAAIVAIGSPAPAEPVQAELTLEPADLRAEPPVLPTFVRQADRAARWRRPGVRAALAGAAALGSVLLALQVAYEYRDWTAARWPATQPLLAAACNVTGCRIGPPRAIEAISVESSGLVRVDNSALYRLSVVLRNRAALALALPSIELSLTDTQGALIARRVIAAAELNPAQPLLPAAGELTLQGVLGSSDKPISGYTIEIFYP